MRIEERYPPSPRRLPDKLLNMREGGGKLPLLHDPFTLQEYKHSSPGENHIVFIFPIEIVAMAKVVQQLHEPIPKRLGGHEPERLDTLPHNIGFVIRKVAGEQVCAERLVVGGEAVWDHGRGMPISVCLEDPICHQWSGFLRESP